MELWLARFERAEVGRCGLEGCAVMVRPERFGDLIDGLGSTMFTDFDTAAFANMTMAEQASAMEACSAPA